MGAKPLPISVGPGSISLTEARPTGSPSSEVAAVGRSSSPQSLSSSLRRFVPSLANSRSSSATNLTLSNRDDEIAGQKNKDADSSRGGLGQQDIDQSTATLRAPEPKTQTLKSNSHISRTNRATASAPVSPAPTPVTSAPEVPPASLSSKGPSSTPVDAPRGFWSWMTWRSRPVPGPETPSAPAAEAATSIEGAAPPSDASQHNDTEKPPKPAPQSSWYSYFTRSSTAPAPVTTAVPVEGNATVAKATMAGPAEPADPNRTTDQTISSTRSSNSSTTSLNSKASKSGKDAETNAKVSKSGTSPPNTGNATEATGNGDDLKRRSDSNWAFWYRKNGTDEGELAVDGTPSQDNPKPSQRHKLENQKEGSSKKQTNAAKKQRLARPNIVAPTTEQCFPVYSQSEVIKSSMRRITSFFSKDSTEVQYFDHLLRSPPKRIYKVVVIGVHGFFPTKVVRSILGEPTGTSLKFANEAAHAVQRWAEEKDFMVDIERISLEGEGKVLTRVEKLWKLLQNWIKHIEEADFVLFAAHSQGTPVAVHILARLVEEGHVDGKQLALLGMAGISLGPISGMDQKILMRAYSSIESASLSELFEFQNISSLQSRKYLDSLRTVIAHNAKIVFVGSMNDQLVPLYSAVCAHISHPNIFRAVYVDGEDVAPEFISTLVSLALRLRNVGSSDHDVLKELSSALPGTLTGGGHSKVYNEPRVYDIMVRFALETTSVKHAVPLRVETDFKVPKANGNPYVLPWCMRGMLAEATVRKPSFEEHLNELYSEYENWKPDSKVLKDVKYRLSAIHAKL